MAAQQQRTASVYRADEAQREDADRLTLVESLREVTIALGQTGVGTGAGAVVAGFDGSSIGGRKGPVIGAVVDAAAGGIVLQAIENQSPQVPGIEITGKLDNGELRTIVQEIDGQQFMPGDRVRLPSAGGVTRVLRYEPGAVAQRAALRAALCLF